MRCIISLFLFPHNQQLLKIKYQVSSDKACCFYWKWKEERESETKETLCLYYECDWHNGNTIMPEQNNILHK